jgi:hypothetical protein
MTYGVAIPIWHNLKLTMPHYRRRGYSRNDDVHTERDTLDTINFDLAVAILKMNTAFVAEQLGS